MTSQGTTNAKEDAGSLASSLTALLKRKAYSSFVQKLHDHSPARARTVDPADLLAAWEKVLDTALQVRDHTPAEEHVLLYSLLHAGLHMQYAPFLQTKEIFAEYMSASREGSLYRQEQELLFGSLWDHPLAIALREEFVLIDRQAAINHVKAAWTTGDRTAFLYVVDALTLIQNQNQRQIDRRLPEGSFSDAIASHPDLELIVIPVQRGNAIDGGNIDAPLPPLRLIVSNKPLPVDYAEETTEEPDTGFTLASANGTYLALKHFMMDALAERHESVGHGPYYYSSNNDRGLSTASNVIAAIHHNLATPTNFAFNAQQRLKEQIEAIKNIAVGSTYAHRYLRSSAQCSWSEALNFANGVSRKLDTLTPRLAAEALTTHGMSLAVERLLTIRVTEADDIPEARLGYLQGMFDLHADMVELVHAEGQMTEALERYERYRGFHPDVLMFPVEERSRLAFQDISDMLTAHLTGLTMQQEMFEKEQPIASNIDFPGIVKTMIAAGDLTNAMRVYTTFGIKHTPEIEQAISQSFKDFGYHVFPEFKIKNLNGLSGRALLDSEGNLYSKLVNATHYQSVEQITAGTDLAAASLAYHLLTSLKFRDDVSEKPREQIEALRDFIARRSLVNELQSGLKDLPDQMKPLYLDGVALEADDLADNLALKGVKNPQAAVREAISEISGTKPKAAFHRIMRALGKVSELMNQRTRG